ncbi:ABC transporter permease [Pseudoflavonifractor phocaeensis]|uniref:ABC transporter permease n=1 Tax=Pseudoflavonifractor phocaeensis TaxID=1870988 RepID=UPI001F44F935|nr:ABC transporter permease [Pseudoflavonifractor phocaeensis]MCF2595348.1 ABC transporter permease [Pseudoflavonifractor phocaeensis]
MLLSITTIQTALAVGAIYSLVALALFISFSILNIADLSTDGCYTLGFAVGATVTLAGHPFLALPAAMAAGACSGFVTAFLQTKLGVESILAGIIVNTGLYTVNLAVMGWSSNLSIYGSDSLFSLAKGLSDAEWWRNWYKVIVPAAILLLICLFVAFFFRTRLGLSIRATGDNADMIRASSINPAFTITVGLCLANSLTALAGCLYGLLNTGCDINLGTGMVTVALASLVIGESLMGRGSIPKRIFGVVLGACLYRLIMAVAIGANIPTECFKLVSALIVAVAIATPQGRKLIALQRQKMAARRKGGTQQC